MRRWIPAALAAAALMTLGTAQARDYVLSASSWGPAQTAAVEAAGGQLRFSHASGLAVAHATDAAFLARLLASGAVSQGAADRVVQQAPVQVAGMELAEEAVGVTAPAPVTDGFLPFLQWVPQSVGAPAAWASGYTGKGVRVAVIDGGIFSNHADLRANLDTVAARSFVGSTPGSCAARWDCDTGTFWHGTHVAGIVAAPANGSGMVGVAHEATIVPVKALHGGFGSFASVIAAILYAANEGRADIINMSLGAVVDREEPGMDELISMLNRALNHAASRGVLVVSAAGNDSLDLDRSGSIAVLPAESGNGMAVSATGPKGFALGATHFSRFSSYSNYGGSVVSVAAPGGDFQLDRAARCTLARVPSGSVTRPCWVFDMVLSTVRGGSNAPQGTYDWTAGTSMAAPVVSAVAAMVKQKYPDISVGALKTRLMRTAIDEGKRGNDPFYGKGFINAPSALAD